MAEPKLSARQEARLQVLGELLARQRQSMLYVDYRRAEQDCEALAAKLLAELSRSALGSFRFQGIPRGGLVVLGMLSYVLDLRPGQLDGSTAPETPLVLVDDCCLSGARLAETLRRVEAPAVVVAHLYSTASLRQVVLEKEPRVSHCLAAHDLEDLLTTALSSQEREAWEARWRQRLGGEERYWLGVPQRVAFAWNEPDLPCWNPVTKQLEDGWRFLPPDLCLKNRISAPPREGAEIHPRRWRISEVVVSGEFDEEVWLCQTQTQQVAALDGVAARMWRLLGAWGEPEAIVRHLTREFAVTEARARQDLEAMIAAFLEAGLLEEVGG